MLTFVECKEKGKPTITIGLHGIYTEKAVRAAYLETLINKEEGKAVELRITKHACKCGENLATLDYCGKCGEEIVIYDYFFNGGFDK